MASIRSEKRKGLHGAGDLIKEKFRELGFGNTFGLGKLDGLLRAEEHVEINRG